MVLITNLKFLKYAFGSNYAILNIKKQIPNKCDSKMDLVLITYT